MTSDELTPTGTRTSKFLEVEEMALNLASRLSRLDEEAERYSRSAAQFSEAAQATRDLTAAVRVVADDAAKALHIVASAGGPEIISRLERVDSQAAAQADGVQKRLLSAETRAAVHATAVEKNLKRVLLLAGASTVLAVVSTLLLLLGLRT